MQVPVKYAIRQQAIIWVNVDPCSYLPSPGHNELSKVSIGSDNGMVPISQQATHYLNTSDGLMQSHIYASISLNVL